MIINKGRWSIKFWNDYQFKNVNWINYTPIAIDLEWDKVTQNYDIELAFLGLHFQILYFYRS